MAYTSLNSSILLSIIALLFILGQCSSQTLSTLLDDSASPSSMRQLHEEWMEQYGRVYTQAIEKEKRYQIFIKNMKLIQTFNSSSKSYSVRANAFADLTTEEIRATRTGSKSFSRQFNEPIMANSSFETFDDDDQSDLAPSVDWRQRGAVTPVKDQGNCGSCWTFATVAAIESAYQTKTGNLIPLSEQKLLDCVPGVNNNGCNGGYMQKAFTFLTQGGHRLPTEFEYPYIGYEQNQCYLSIGDEPGDVGVGIKSFKYLLQSNDFDALRRAVNRQPVAVSIDSKSWNFHYYGGGIYDEPLNTGTDHDVLLIGYGMDEFGNNYWLLKNSWGVNWGENGYMRLLMDENRCPLAQYAYFPEI